MKNNRQLITFIGGGEEERKLFSPPLPIIIVVKSHDCLLDLNSKLETENKKHLI